MDRSSKIEAILLWLESKGYIALTNVDSSIKDLPLDILAKNKTDLHSFIFEESNYGKKLVIAKALCDFSYIVTDKDYTSCPQLLSYADSGFGILSVVDSDVIVVKESKRFKRNAIAIEQRGALVMRLSGQKPHVKTITISYDKNKTYEAILQYLREHPYADWKELFENIPNPCKSVHAFRSFLEIPMKRLLEVIENEDKDGRK